MAKADGTNVPPMDVKLEVVVVGVTGVDRAKACSEKPAWRLDADFVGGEEFRAVRREWKR